MVLLGRLGTGDIEEALSLAVRKHTTNLRQHLKSHLAPESSAVYTEATFMRVGCPLPPHFCEYGYLLGHLD